jgi:hypothetical protein
MINLVDAINNRQVLACIYDGKPRTIEPHAYGRSAKDGTFMLRCFQTNDPDRPWKLFHVAKMVDIAIAKTPSAAPRPGYKAGDKHMAEILAELPA